MPKTMTLRLADEQASVLEMVARADGQSLNDAIRVAIDEHIEQRRSDAEFMARLRERHERDRALYERLAK